MTFVAATTGEDSVEPNFDEPNWLELRRAREEQARLRETPEQAQARALGEFVFVAGGSPGKEAQMRQSYECIHGWTIGLRDDAPRDDSGRMALDIDQCASLCGYYAASLSSYWRRMSEAWDDDADGYYKASSDFAAVLTLISWLTGALDAGSNLPAEQEPTPAV